MTSEATAKTKTTELDYAKARYAQISVERDVTVVTVDGGTMWSASRRGGMVISTPFDASATEPIAAFGDPKSDTSAGRRMLFGPDEPRGSLRGLLPFVRGTWLAFDTVGLRVTAREAPSMKQVATSTMVLDLLRPAKDNRGEPTRRETADFRARFKKVFAKVQNDDDLLVGVVALPKALREGEPHQFLAATRIAGFPLVTVECSETSLAHCQIRRGCFVEGQAWPVGPDQAGLALLPEERLVLIGDAKHHEIRLFRYRSCLGVSPVGVIKLPKKLKTLSALHVDADGTLWVATAAPDDYLNASIFGWAKADWQ